MDPNRTLELIRKYAEEISKAKTQAQRAALGRSLAGHVEDLDEWLTKGGFLPEAWSTRRDVQRQYDAEVASGRIREVHEVR